MNRLIKQKLAVEVFDGWKKFWSAQDPVALQNVLEQNQQKLQKNLPLFGQLTSQNSPETIKYYTTKSVIKNLYNELIDDLKSEDWYYVFGNQSDWLDIDRDFYTDFIRRRNSMDINIKIILCISDDALNQNKLQNSTNVEIKIYESINPITTNFVLTPSRLIMHNLNQKEHRAVSVIDQSTVFSFKEMFEMVWEGL